MTLCSCDLAETESGRLFIWYKRIYALVFNVRVPSSANIIKMRPQNIIYCNLWNTLLLRSYHGWVRDSVKMNPVEYLIKSCTILCFLFVWVHKDRSPVKMHRMRQRDVNAFDLDVRSGIKYYTSMEFIISYYIL